MPKANLIVEGWRFVPHSYAIVNQWQCLALLRRGVVNLRVHDLPYIVPQWSRTYGLFDPADEAVLRDIPLASVTDVADATLRIEFPYNFSRSSSTKTWVYGTAEYGCLPPSFMKSKSGRAGRADLRGSPCNVITPSRWSAAGFTKAGLESDRVVVIPHGVEPSIFCPMPDQRDGLRRKLNISGFTFLSIGTMVANKGVDLLLKAFAAVTERVPDVRLVLKGTDALYSSLDLVKQHLRELPTATQDRIVSRLTYIGASLTMRQMAALYQGVDAYVSPYRAEGFNLPVLEAVACGLPVLCTAGGSTDDFTRPEFALPITARSEQVMVGGIEGRSLEPDADHLIELMLYVMENSVWRQQAQQAGPAFVADGFTWDHVARKLEEVVMCG